MTEPTLEENVRQILPTLPLPIQKFFEQHKLSETARDLMERYALHIDQGTVLERELMLVLLGLEGPDEFAEALYKELPISKQTVLDIISDLNKEVFIPLREEEKKSGMSGAPKPPAPLSAAAQVLPFQSPGTMIPANPRLPNDPVYMSNVGPAPVRTPARPEPTEPPQGNKSPSPLAQAIGEATKEKVPQSSPSTASSFASLPPKTTMPRRPVTDASKLLEDREEPSPPLKTTEETQHTMISLSDEQPSQNPVNLISRPPAPPRPAADSFGSGAPANLPGASAEELVPPAPPKPTPPAVRPPRPAAPAPAPAKPYSTDPYREPIEN